MYNKHISINVLVGIVSKFIVTVKTITLLPIAIKLLGEKGYAEYIFLTAIFGFVQFVSVGLNPNISYSISRGDDIELQKMNILLSLRVMATFSIFVLIVFVIFDEYQDIGTLFNKDITNTSFFIYLLITLIILMSTVADSIRVGRKEHYAISFQELASNAVQLMILLFIYYSNFERIELNLFILITVGVLSIIKSAHLLTLFSKLKYLKLLTLKGHVNSRAIKNVIKIGIPALMVQLSVYFSLHMVILIVTGLGSPHDIVKFQANNTFVILSAQVAGLVIAPLGIMIHGDISNGEHSNAYRKLKSIIPYLYIMLGVFLCIFLTLYDEIINVWIGSEYILLNGGKYYIALLILVNISNALLFSIATAYEKFSQVALFNIVQSTISMIAIFGVFKMINELDYIYLSQLVTGLIITASMSFYINKIRK